MPTKTIAKDTDSLKIIKKAPKRVKKVRSEHRREFVISEAIIRPTGLLDPEIIIKPVTNQVDDVLEQVRQRVQKGERVLITTLTKKFAEELDIYFKQLNIKSAYIHSEVETLDRIDILSDLRRGKYDVLIGINLLREGLDLPEVSLVAVFDADKEGFLRSRTSLIQIVGRAARNLGGQVIMYADRITESMRLAIEETDRRRDIQIAYNLKHGIVPKSTKRELQTIADEVREEIKKDEEYGKSEGYFTPMGWEDNGLKKGKVQTNNSVHGTTGRTRGKSKAKQVYENFDDVKEGYLQELHSLSLNSSELQERLRIAIDAMNFEEAAAIRDIIKENDL